MDYAEFQAYYEQAAKSALNTYLKLTEDDLLELINEKKWDTTYQIWYALKIKGSSKSIKPLFKIVSDLNFDYLVRYHACNALFHLAQIHDEEFKGMVQYGRNKLRAQIDQKKALKKLKELLIKQSLLNN